jgi:hypothetical protein
VRHSGRVFDLPYKKALVVIRSSVAALLNRTAVLWSQVDYVTARPFS